jgi:hypothetical protein
MMRMFLVEHGRHNSILLTADKYWLHGSGRDRKRLSGEMFLNATVKAMFGEDTEWDEDSRLRTRPDIVAVFIVAVSFSTLHWHASNSTVLVHRMPFELDQNLNLILDPTAYSTKVRSA